MWKPLSSRRILKILRFQVSPQRGQYPLAVGLGCYKWYQSQTPGGVSSRTLGGLTSIGEGNECQREQWTPKGGGLGDPISVGEENEELGCGNLSIADTFYKPLRGNPKEKVKKDNIC